jgi:23S rRNA pseudouridine1911/1915/1917 synthase
MKRRTLRVDRIAPLGELVEPSLVANGAVYVDGKRSRDPARELRVGQTVTVVLEESGRSTSEASVPPAALEVLYEDAEILAVNKPAGVLAQPSEGRAGESLLDAVSARLSRPAGLVHRLDRDTSGVTVFGKTPEATAELTFEFREGTARKRYLAVCGPGLPERGVIDLPISKDPSRPGKYRASKKANGKPALTEYERLAEGDGFCVVSLWPKTGRTHQLRAHLSALGCPILGDTLYGGASVAARCLLHAWELHLARPLDVTAPLPEDLRAYFTA